VNPWLLAYDGFDPPAERLREALCTLGNGYFATRGAVPEAAADAVHYPGTYVGGVYNRLVSRVAGREVENEDLVNVPNWLPLTIRSEGGQWLDLEAQEVLAYRQELDLRRGVLMRLLRVRDRDGRVIGVTQRRFVSMDDPHLAGLETTVVPENWSGSLEVRSALDGRVTNAGVERYRELDGRHLVPIEVGAVGDDTVWLLVKTRTSRVRIAQAARTRIVRDGQTVAAARRSVREPDLVAEHLIVDVREGEPVTVEKLVALHTSRDRAIAEAGHAASATSTSQWPTTSGSTTRSPATWRSWTPTGPRCCWRSPASGPASPPTTTAATATRSAG
jgi:trehalose/maltose hydrolase-like predicted phosphorylase